MRVARESLTTLSFVAAGGAVGAIARWGVQGGGEPTIGGDVWRTVAINVIGCFAIGVLVAWLTRRPTRFDNAAGVWSKRLRAFIGIGFLGGFTTFSAYAGDAVELMRQGSWAGALAYLAGTLVLCLVAVALGQAAVRRAVGS